VTGARDGATQQAESAAAASRVEIRTLHDVDQLRGVIALFDEVWSTSGAPPIGLEHLIALAHAGCYVGGAYDGDELLGASVAFLATPIGEVLHSDVTAVAERARDRRLGFAIKLHQRAWALNNGLSRITWTFDPLIRRNAYFNLVKLGASVSAYLIDFYGDMPDPVNAGQGSDRVLASWALTDPVVDDACGGRLRTPPRGIGAPLLTVGADQEPVIAGAEAVDDLFVRLAVPEDIEGLRRSDPDLGRVWRQVVRDSLGRELISGGRVAGFDPATGYLVERAPA
jgi:predicted GNAT superfamily acetyltransferase